VVFNDTEGRSLFNMTAKLDKRLIKIFVTSEIFRKSMNASFGSPLIKQTIDTCNAQKGVIGSFLLQAVIDNLKNYSNYKFECPQVPDVFYCYNFPINLFTDYFPRSFVGMFAEEQPIWEAVVTGKAKFTKSKSLQPLFTWKFSGSWQSDESF
jgi:Protein of unknown function (DUF1091)